MHDPMVLIWSMKGLPITPHDQSANTDEHCQRRMNTAVRHGYMSSDKTYHRECMDLAHVRTQKQQLLETMARVFAAQGIDSEDQLKALIADPTAREDTFSLWYQTWKALEFYKGERGDRWRPTNWGVLSEEEKQAHHNRWADRTPQETP